MLGLQNQGLVTVGQAELLTDRGLHKEGSEGTAVPTDEQKLFTQ